MDTRNITLNHKEKAILTTAGRAFKRVGKTLGILFLISMVLTGFTVGTSDPHYSHLTLDGGESSYLNPFFVEDNTQYQITFGVDGQNGNEYTYDKLDQEWGFVDHLSSMDWVIQVVVEKSDSLKFENPVVVADFSGDLNFLQLDLETGFYRIKVTNLTENTLSFSVGRTHVNIGLLVATIVFWTLFALTVGLFAFMVHISVTALVFYLFVRLALYIAEENNHKSQPTIIAPQTE